MKAKQWLYVAALFTAISGVLLVLGSLLPGVLDPVLSLLFGQPVVLDAPARLGTGIAGALMTGWAAMLVLLVRSLESLTPSTLGTATAVGVATWYLLDGLVSIVNGAALNVAGNTLFLLILIVPALKLRNYRAVDEPATAPS